MDRFLHVRLPRIVGPCPEPNYPAPPLGPSPRWSDALVTMLGVPVILILINPIATNLQKYCNMRNGSRNVLINYCFKIT